jgi:hypothetical protein
MDPDAITFAVVCTTIVAAVGCLVAIGVTARLLLMRAKRLSDRPPLEDNRLRHLEEAVDAIAIEVERISEAQRFTTKLLAQSTDRFAQSAVRGAQGTDP